MLCSYLALFHADDTYFLPCNLQNKTDHNKVFILPALKPASISVLVRLYLYFHRWKKNESSAILLAEDIIGYSTKK